MRTAFVLALLIALPDRPDQSPREKPKSLQELFLGDWGIEKTDVTGNRYGDINSIWRITPSGAIWVSGGTPMDANGLTASYTIDWTKNPITIDLKPKSQTAMPGILRIDGDRMVMALDTAGTNRPASFENAPWIHAFIRIQK